MDLRYAEMDKLKQEGKTHKEIGEIFGISRQRVYQILGKNDKRYFKEIKKNKVGFKGLREWMNKNRVSIAGLIRNIYGNYYVNTYYMYVKYFNGTNEIKYTTIMKVLKYTGLTFEEAFGEYDGYYKQ